MPTSADVEKIIEKFAPRQDIHGLGLRSANNFNKPRFRLLKIQENVLLQALKLHTKLPQDRTVLCLKKFDMITLPNLLLSIDSIPKDIVRYFQLAGGLG